MATVEQIMGNINVFAAIALVVWLCAIFNIALVAICQANEHRSRAAKAVRAWHCKAFGPNEFEASPSFSPVAVIAWAVIVTVICASLSFAQKFAQ